MSDEGKTIEYQSLTGVAREGFDLLGFPMELFLSKVRKGAPDECWEFQCAPQESGHCRFGWRYESVWRGYMAHRLAYLFSVADPGVLCVLHRCDNPPCCNPSHLFLGTTVDNRDDCVKKNRHAFGAANGRSKLTEDMVVQIRNLYAGSTHPTTTELAKEFGVSRIMIGNIVSGRSWHSAGGPIVIPRVGRRKSI